MGSIATAGRDRTRCDDAVPYARLVAVLPASIVDALPQRLWWLGNSYRVFGHSLHLCVGGGKRTLEVDGREIGRGQRPLPDFHDPPSDDAIDLLWRLDIGWIAVTTLLVVVAVGVTLTYVASDRRRSPDT